jgi:hypothetical protein
MINLLLINIFASLNNKKEKSNVKEDIKTVKEIKKSIKEYEELLRGEDND